jgi:acetyl esterase/lipase
MHLPLTLLALLLTATLHAADPEKIPLWPQGAPGAKGTEDKDQPFLLAWPAPKATATGAAFVVCPGGGYGGLAADHEGTQVAQWLNGLGVSAYVLHYRLGTNGYHYPIQLMDVQRAVRWVRAKAPEHGRDPARIGIIGFSAGGHLTSMAATLFDEKPAAMTHDDIDQLSARPDVAVPVYPVISMSDASAHQGSRKNLLGPDHTEDQARHVSTQLRVTPNTPPTFLFQTDQDTVVPAENAVAFYLACRQNKVPAELHIYEPGPHGVGLSLGNPVLGSWPAHLRDWLRNRGFLSPAPRTAIKGTVKINGTPVSWGFLVFRPRDPSAPVATARIMKGNFKLEAANGPALGENLLTLSYSAADTPGATSPDGTLTTTHPTPDHTGDWIQTLTPEQADLHLDVQHK